ncbi:MAG: WD40 repeat domain-containing protein, partial [Anaerolineales bacterium]
VVHDGSVFGLSFSPDGQTALVSSLSDSLDLWDLASGEVIRSFVGHTLWTNKVVLSPDGQTAYSTSDDNTVRAWDFATGELVTTYQPFSDGGTAGLAISPDGGKLLVGRTWFDLDNVEPRDAVIALLDAKTGERLLNLEGHTGTVETITFSPDGRYALSGSWDRTVRLWDVSTGLQLAVLTGHTGIIWRVAFSPDGLTGYSTGEDGSLRLWDLRDYIGVEAGTTTES